MKKITMFCVIVAVYASCFITSSAATKIKETPTVKIIVDGVQMKTNSSPISLDGRTLVGLRDLLVALGVPNDADHIIWDSETKTIKAIKEETQIELTVGQKKALVDGAEVELEVEPVVYKNNTYIPARFIAESLKKKVFWDNYTRSLSICDEEMYKKINSLYNNENEPIKFQYSVTNETFTRGGSEIYSESTESKFDVEKNIEYSKVRVTENYVSTSTQYYENEIYLYSKPDYRDKWKRIKKSDIKNNDAKDKSFTNDTIKTMVSNFIYKELDSGSSVADGDYMLEGDSLYFAVSMTKGTELDVLKDKTSKCHIKMVYNSANVMRSMEIRINGTVKTSSGNKSYQLYRYIDYNIDQPIKSVPAPKDLKNFYTIPKGYQEYYNIKNAFSMIVPESWMVPDASDDESMVVYVDPKNNNKWCGIFVEKVFMGGEEINLTNVKNIVVKNMKNSMLNPKLVIDQKTKWKSYSAVKVIISGKDKKTKALTKTQVIIVNYKGTVLIFTYMGDNQTFAKKSAEAIKIINTWTSHAVG